MGSDLYSFWAASSTQQLIESQSADMNHSKTIIVVAAILASAPFAAVAADTVVVNGWMYQCQHTCEVTADSNGQLFVRDSEFGWVQMMGRGKYIPVPNNLISPENSSKVEK